MIFDTFSNIVAKIYFWAQNNCNSDINMNTTQYDMKTYTVDLQMHEIYKYMIHIHVLIYLNRCHIHHMSQRQPVTPRASIFLKSPRRWSLLNSTAKPKAARTKLYAIPRSTNEPRSTSSKWNSSEYESNALKYWLGIRSIEELG